MIDKRTDAGDSRYEHAEGIEGATEDYRLPNGLRVLLHRDDSVPMVTINLLYHVGSKDEVRGRTGFAHLFEHLMFDGSANVERGGYDRHCTMVGGDNNAYTTSDFTDYQLALPCEHLALGLWLESDRMSGFGIEQISLDTQKNVVIEEKRQVQDDVPYGEMTVAMREISYPPEHPYAWETIGLTEDISAATMDDVRDFYNRYYTPSDAVLVIAGGFDTDEVRSLVQAYFGPIPMRPASKHPDITTVPAALTGNRRTIRREILPFNAVFMGYHAPPVGDRDFLALDLLSAILAEGESSRLYQSLEYELEIASEAECFIDDGELGSMIYIYAVAQDAKITAAVLESALRAEIARVACEGIDERELGKVKNRKMTRIVSALQSVSDRAERLAYFAAVFDNPDLAFAEAELYASITVEDIQRVVETYLISAQPNVIEYEAIPKRGRRKRPALPVTVVA